MFETSSKIWPSKVPSAYWLLDLYLYLIKKTALNLIFQLKEEETNLKQELSRLRDEYEELKKGIGLLGNDKLLADYAETLQAIDRMQKKYAFGARRDRTNTPTEQFSAN